MLSVFICEDSSMQRKRVTGYINQYIKSQRLDMQVKLSTGNPFEVIDELKAAGTNEMGLYFLDIDLQQPEMNGFQLAQKIREYDPRGFIIFITTHAELSYMTFTYKVEALDYIIKDDFNEMEKRVYDCLAKAEERVNVKPEAGAVFTLQISDKKVIRERFDDILFFETSPTAHKVILHGKNRQIEFYGKLKNIEKMLDDTFYRCHRSFIVNKKNIHEMDKSNGVLKMINGENCYVSTKQIKSLSF